MSVRAAISKTELASALARRFGNSSLPREKFAFETLATGITEIDEVAKGIPRSAITEIIGGTSSGRTSVLVSALAQATWGDEVCALIDTGDKFDPVSAAHAGMAPDRLLWIRCRNDLEQAFKATDLVLQSGGFGLVVLDIADVAAPTARRIVSTWWYRFHRAIEHTPTALLVVSQTCCVRSCASVSFELKHDSPSWTLATGSIETKPALKANEFDNRVQSAQDRLILVSGLARQDTRLTHSILLREGNVETTQRKPTVFALAARFRTHAITAQWP